MDFAESDWILGLRHVISGFVVTVLSFSSASFFRDGEVKQTKALQELYAARDARANALLVWSTSK